MFPPHLLSLTTNWITVYDECLRGGYPYPYLQHYWRMMMDCERWKVSHLLLQLVVLFNWRITLCSSMLRLYAIAFSLLPTYIFHLVFFYFNLFSSFKFFHLLIVLYQFLCSFPRIFVSIASFLQVLIQSCLNLVLFIYTKV